jgi:lipoate---protein ligase
MDLVDLTLATPAENLALDEALLDEAEAAPAARETLRLWESPEPVVVVGRNSEIALEVREDACRQRGVHVLRRASGGCAIVAGPGCLMYAAVLSYELRPELRNLDAAHRLVLGTIAKAISSLATVERRGTSDLVLNRGAALGEVKFSGNSVRCRRRGLLYHGTLLYDFSLALVDELLTMPPRQPDYRRDRDHKRFIANLPVGGDALRQALVAGWQADTVRNDWPRERVQALVADRYGRDDWNLRR